jgi:hypothetical protein
MVATAFRIRRQTLAAMPAARAGTAIDLGHASGILLLDLVTTLQAAAALAPPHDLDVADRLDAVHGGTHLILDHRDRAAFAAWRSDRARMAEVLAGTGLEVDDPSDRAALDAIERCVLACAGECVVMMCID